MAAGFAKTFESATSDIPPVSTNVVGSLPSWLRGTLLRNGPGRFEVGPTAYRHWFDGQAMLHSFNIEEKKVTYSARFLQTDQYKATMEAGRIVTSEFGTPVPPDPCQNIFRRFFSHFKRRPNDNANVSVYPINDKWIATGEVPLMWQFDPSTLDAVKQHNTAKASGLYLIVNTVHPHDAGNGEIYNFGTSAGIRPKYNLLRSRLVPAATPDDEPTLQSDILCSIPSRASVSYYHSFARTENYVVLPEMPIKYSLFHAGTMQLRGQSFADCLYWQKDIPTRLHVIDLTTNKELTARYQTDPFFTFHHVNAYEDRENKQIVMDAFCYPDAQIIHDFYLIHLRSGELGSDPECFFPRGSFRRFYIPLEEASTTKTIEVPYEDMFDCGGELPGINSKYIGKKYRYAYGLCQKMAAFGGLVKLDVETKESKEWIPGEGLYASEPVFISSPDEKGEDDGVILSAVVSSDPDQNPSFLAILDAASFTLLASAEVPCHLASTLHGRFTTSKTE